MTDIYALMYIVLSILIYNLIFYINVLRKQKTVFKSNNIYLSKNKKNFINSYINKIELKLFNLGYPYNLNTKKYIVLKYVLSTAIFFIAILNYGSIKIPSIIFLIIFFTPNYLLYNHYKNESNILINEIKNVTNSIILGLSAYGTLENSLNIAKTTIEYPRFLCEFEKFIYEYKMYGYNIKQAAINLEKKFKSYELSLFLSTLIQGDKEGSLQESLEKFSETLELNYFKYLKKKSAQRLLYVTLGTVFSLVNIILVVMYPILKQVIDNLQVIFS